MNTYKQLKELRKSKGKTTYELSELTGIPQSTISKMENGKRRIDSDSLQKITRALQVPIGTVFAEEFDAKYDTKQLKEECSLYETGAFKTAEAAMQFILSQPSIMAYGGFDINKLSDQDKIDFANDLLSQLKLLGLKYNK
ncbi:MerR family transcriptional regulator [Clostridium carnis]|uniref:MerR family transcriptional regulator n=1 Tax=Clostridium carnis TaxID=1530 RepID=A0ABY6T0T2_9CLOT|nr:helix-turn-helix transcriptional regulator [Clostridium carnis]VDG74661.1 MerR family transcriptional regulator [Clostridium carnis]